MSRAIAAARPSIKSAVAAGRQPTPQSTKQTRPMADCRSASIKALPRRRPAAIIPPLRRLVSPRLTRRSHPDCRAISEPALRNGVAFALYRKGFLLSQFGREQQAIAAYEDLLSRFGDANEQVLLEQVADALLGKGLS